MQARDSRFPENVWRDMCTAYRDPDLAAACLDLQDHHAVDVPLLLVWCLADQADYGLQAPAVELVVDQAVAWRTHVIEPLRSARRDMKHRFTRPAEAALRQSVKAAELEAERLHVQRIVASMPEQEPAATPAALHYLDGVGVPRTVADTFLRTFAAACISRLESVSE